MTFFDHTDYREALRELVVERKRLDTQFGFHSLADAARIQRPYMSKVISGKAELSVDQLYLICESLGLDSERAEFIELLLNYSRSAVTSRKKKLKSRIDATALSKRTSHANLKSKVATTTGNDDLTLYYLNPWTQIVHVALSIPRYSSDPKLLAQVLGISPHIMQTIFRDLTALNLIYTEGDKILPRDGHLHLSRSSAVFQPWKTQIRLAGMQRQSNLTEDTSYSFTAVFSATEEARKKIHAKFLLFLKEFEVEARDAESHNIYQIAFDLFPWA
jgi:uncharacterized protein (TIGR02147 family)